MVRDVIAVTRFGYLIFPLAFWFSLAAASPTANEFTPCHQAASASLFQCLEKNAGYVNDDCWNAAKRRNTTCYASLQERHRPDKARIEAAEKAMKAMKAMDKAGK